MTRRSGRRATQPVEDGIPTREHGNGVNRSNPAGDVAYGSGDRLA